MLETLGSLCLYISASDGKVLGCGLDSSVFCHQSACPSLLPCGFSTSTLVKGSRRRLPIKLREVLRPDSLNVCWCEIHFGYPVIPVPFSTGQLFVESALL